MLKNFFTTAFRNIRKHKAYSIINFVGLTCGLTLSLLIISYIRHEWSYDRYHEHADRLYRLSYKVPNGLELASTPPPIAPKMAEFFPGVELAGRMYLRNVTIARTSNLRDAFEETDVLFADSAIMKMLTIDFIDGDRRAALREPFTLLITEETSKKYFGDKNPIGESLTLGGTHPFRVAAVVKNFPENSNIRFHMLVPYDNMYDLESPQGAAIMRQNLAINFVISHSYTYVLLKPGADPAAVDKAMPDFLKKYSPPNLLVGQVFTLMPVTDIHLKSILQAEPTTTNSMTTLYIFGAVGLLTLLIACINYINLSTAQSFTRIREIGIRKILGSGKSQLIVQFIAESFLFCLVAMVLSYVAFYFGLPLLNQLTSKNLVFSTVVDGTLVATSVALLVIITLLAGGYPAVFVAQFNSIASLKGDGSSVHIGSQLLRKGLVVFQLMIACMLLSGSLMLVKQLTYLNNIQLGFEKDHVVTIPLASQNLNYIFGGADSTFRSRLQSFRDQIEAEASVEGTTVSSAAPGLGGIYRGAIPEGFTQDDNLFICNLAVDYDFIKTFGIQMVAGRPFSREYSTDQREGFIVNETAVREFKWESPEKALGKTMNREGKIGKVIGVVKDFNMASLTTPMAALILEISPSQWANLSIRIKAGDPTAITDRLRGQWNALFPEKAFEFSFLDEQLNSQYSSFQNFGKVIESFTIVAILISCLGVYGLVLFVVKRKVKEIGVRKVLGSSVGGILKLIYSDFAVLLVAGFILAVPASYYLISKWLENFTFRTSIDGWTYLISFVLVWLIVTLTISYQAIKASLANPVHSLRTE